MNIFFVSALLLGVGGSLHCLGMCGPLQLAMPFGALGSNNKWTGLLSYHTARITAYTLLGVLMGMLGSTFRIAGLSQVLSILMGSIILVFILFPHVPMFKSSLILTKFRSCQQRALKHVLSKRGPGWLLAAGFLNGLLPCGLVYSALAAATATSSISEGALFMFLFGVGTMPALVTLVSVGSFISVPVRKKLNKVSPIFAFAIGLLLLLRGLNLGIPYVSPEVINADGKQEMECCHKPN